MEDHLTVSVITPSFNNSRFIERAILSVGHQSYPFIEHIVADGGSKDGTVDILKRYDNKIRWFSEPDRGFADAVNKALKLASGQIINILNSDDTYYSKDAVQAAVDAFNKNPSAGIIFGDYAVVNEADDVLVVYDGHGRRFNFNDLLCSSFVFPQNSAFIRRGVLDAVGGSLDLEADWCADFDLWARIGLQYPIVYLPKVISTYRRHSGQRNADFDYTTTNNPQARRFVLNKIFSSPSLPAEVSKIKAKAFSITYWNQANALIRFSKTKSAMRPLAKAVWLNPGLLLSRRMLNLWKQMILKHRNSNAQSSQASNDSNGNKSIPIKSEWWVDEKNF